MTDGPRERARSPRGGIGGKRSKLFAGGALLAVVVAVVFVVFGSTNSPVTDPIAEAATLSSGTPGYQLNMEVTMSTPAASAPITAYGHAVVDVRDQSMSMTMSMDLSQEPQAAQALGSTAMRLDMILSHGVMYMRLPARVSQQVPQMAGKEWLKFDLSKVAGLPGMSSLGNNPTMTDPSHLLQYLLAASDSVTNEGSQLIGGVPTTHYRVMLDLNNLAANLPAAERAAVQSALAQLRSSTNLSQIPMDVWVDARHLVRRIAMSLALPAGLQESMTVDLTDYGPQAQATPPPAGQVEDIGNLIHISF